jgi:signal transduction histidine kinase
VSPGAGAAGLEIDEVLNILSRSDDADLGEIVELVANICECGAAGITIQRGEDYHVPIAFGVEPFVCPASDTFCQFTMSTDGVYCIEDVHDDPRFSAIGATYGELPRTRFYASAPLYTPRGEMVGRLCVMDPKPKSLTALQRRSLETLALSATKLIELRLLRAVRPGRITPQTGQAAATVVSQLAAELSHDMKVPLSSIVASVELLGDELADYPDRTVGALLSRTTRAADRMVRMLEQNMDMSAVSGAPVTREVDLGRVVEQLLLDSEALLEPAGALVVAGDLPVVQADPDDMYSVLQNLVLNSVKFARPDVPPRVHITSRRTDNGWRLSVSDNGVGIPENRRVDVFSLFTRVQTDVSGHGIGLATVARIVAAHGGRVGIEAAQTGGAEIWFELPSDQDASQQRAG